MTSPADADSVKRPTLDEIREWPATVSVPKAGTAWGLGRSTSYDMARRGEFPAAVSKVGQRYKVVTASIIQALSARTTQSAHRAGKRPTLDYLSLVRCTAITRLCSASAPRPVARSLHCPGLRWHPGPRRGAAVGRRVRGPAARRQAVPIASR